ncbi:TetR/AcrR family transcriptional regulator [Nocardia wallacei]|uniref:TetR/AcrR family transcriptional regulator n=1 Tax=Nocardia wallacei TaxID=480035 RepID=UPI0024585521|nr:TetR/AcrR family transcriptional regulator [Nocardia wallacei]
MSGVNGRGDRGPVRRRPVGRREAIVRAATAAFARDGYHATSMADIAAEVGISSTAVYRHFRGKQDLLGETLLSGLDSVLSRLAAAHDEGAGAVLGALTTACLQLRGLPRLWQLEVRNLSATDRIAVLARVVRLSGFLRAAIRERRPDLSRDDVEFLAWCALSVAVSPSYHHLQIPDAEFVRVLDAVIGEVITVRFPVARTGPLDAAVSWKPGRARRYAAEETDPILRPERMISVAARLFNQRGYSAVGIEDIGAEVGVSGPALYHHFDSKVALLNEIVDRNEQWIRLYTSRAMSEGDSPSAALRILLRYFVRFAIREPDLLGTTLSELDHLPTEQASRYRHAHREGIMRWVRMLQVVRPDASAEVARVQIQAMTGVVIDAVRNPRLTGRADLADILVEVGDRAVFADTKVRLFSHE